MGDIRHLVVAAAFLALTAGAASAESIGVFFSPEGWECGTIIPPFGPATWYLCANLGGAAEAGITGAEFRQEGTPAGWPMVAIPNSAASLTFGDPLAGGCNIAFPDCQPGSARRVLLYTVSGTATSAVVNRYLTIARHATPSNPLNVWPILVLCDAPVYTQLRVPGGAAVINGPPCGLAVEPRSWSQVKGLYE